MNTNKLTQKSQEALHDAQVKATRYGHVEIDVEHVLLSLLEQHEGLIPGLFRKMDVPLESARKQLEKELSRRPRVSGSGAGAEPGKVYVTQRFNQLLVRAEDEAKHLKDEYVSVEHLVLAVIEEAPSGPAGRILHEFGINRDRFLRVLMDIRGNQQVRSATP